MPTLCALFADVDSSILPLPPVGKLDYVHRCLYHPCSRKGEEFGFVTRFLWRWISNPFQSRDPINLDVNVSILGIQVDAVFRSKNRDNTIVDSKVHLFSDNPTSKFDVFEYVHGEDVVNEMDFDVPPHLQDKIVSALGDLENWARNRVEEFRNK